MDELRRSRLARSGSTARLPQIVSMKAGRLSTPLCQIPDTAGDKLPGERCRVKRLSKVTGVKQFGSWRLTRQREPGTALTVTARGWVVPVERCSSLYRLIKLRGLGVIGAHSGGAVPLGAVRQPDEKWRLPERRVDYE